MIEENIIKIIEEISGLNAKEIKSSELVDSGILDSFSLLVLISEIEKKLKITLNNESIKKYGYFLTTYKTLDFLGFLAYDSKNEVQEKYEKEFLTCDIQTCICKEKESNTPTHYTESAIVKKLESSGVGRPSTYASTIDTVLKRNYAQTKTVPSFEKEEDCTTLDIEGNIHKETKIIKLPEQKKRILLTDLGEEVHIYLQKHFDTIIIPAFTASVESDLDLIAKGEAYWVDIVRKIYETFHPIVMKQMKEKLIKKDAQIIHGYEVRKGKFGPYLVNQGKNYGITNYLEFKKMKIEELTETDIKNIIFYPLKVGTHKKKDLMVHIGPYGKYLKYNGKNYRIEQKESYDTQYLVRCLNQ